jgi:hypothetical protein
MREELNMDAAAKVGDFRTSCQNTFQVYTDTPGVLLNAPPLSSFRGSFKGLGA